MYVLYIYIYAYNMYEIYTYIMHSMHVSVFWFTYRVNAVVVHVCTLQQYSLDPSAEMPRVPCRVSDT